MSLFYAFFADHSAIATKLFNEPIEPMTLSNMRQLGVQSLAVSCHQCHHETIINAMPEITATMMVAIGRLGAKWIPLFGSR
jgi:hypothetical protein